MRRFVADQQSVVYLTDWERKLIFGYWHTTSLAFKSLTGLEHSLGVGAVSLDIDQIDREAKARILLHIVEGYVNCL